MNQDSSENNTEATQQENKPWSKAILIGFVFWFLSLIFLMETTDLEGFGGLFLSIVIGVITVYVVANGTKETVIKATTVAKKTTRAAEEVLKEADKRVGVKKEIKTEEDAYERAAEELEEEMQNKGIWAKAFSDADGDEQKQKALYIKYRAEQLIRNIVE